MGIKTKSRRGRLIYVPELRKCIPIEDYKPAQTKERSHTVITDEMSGTRHPCNGKVYTSKRKFRDETRARGCVEVGNEVQKDRRDWETKTPLEQVLRDVVNG